MAGGCHRQRRVHRAVGLERLEQPIAESSTDFFWYRRLEKPWFKPKDWVIPVAWTVIEGTLATAAYRLVRAEGSSARNAALGWLSWNIFMIGGWSRLFFKHRSLAVSTLAATTMIFSGSEFVKHARRVDPLAARAGVPFVAWVSFATVLTATIWALNRKK